MVPTLHTAQLMLQPIELADAEQVQKLFANWSIVRFLNAQVPWPYPSDGALTYYRDFALPAMARGEQWHWSIRLLSDPQVILGCISLMRGEENNRGFWMGLPWQGQGFTTEAADAVTDYWFDVLQFPVMRIPKAVMNIASRRISEKQGMRVIATEAREYVCGLLLTEIWEITAEEWRAYRRK